MNLNILTAYSQVVAELEGAAKTITDTLQGRISLNSDTHKNLLLLATYDICDGTAALYHQGKFVRTIDLETVDEVKFYGKTIQIELVRTNIHNSYFICDNWDVLLNYSQQLRSPVMAVYFIDSRTLVTSPDDDPLFQNYINVSKVCGLLDSVANVYSGDDLIIIYKRDLELSYKIKMSDLEHEIDVESLKDLLSEDTHLEAKRGIVRKELVERLSGVNKELRFGHLISHFNAFSLNLSLSYHNYVEDYSFDKVRKEYQEKKTNYIERVNKIFDDVSTKLLSVPAGIWLATTQIKSGTLTSLESYKNISVFAAVTVLFLIMSFSIFGQFSIFSTLKEEYDGLFNRLKSEYPKEENNITKAVQAIQSREFVVMAKLWATFVAALVLIILLLLMLSAAIVPAP